MIQIRPRKAGLRGRSHIILQKRVFQVITAAVILFVAMKIAR